MDIINKYGRIYHEICNGYSKKLLNKIDIYFKHPTLSEHFSNYSNYDLYVKEGASKGLLSEEDKLQEAIDGGWWTSEKESAFKLLNKTIENLNKTRLKLILPSQKQEISNQIKRNEAIALSYSKERSDIIGYTIEQYANSCLTEDLLVNFVYKDKLFTEKLFQSKDDYYNLSESELNILRNYLGTYSIIFNVKNLKYIAACIFFQNLVYLNDDAYGFWGKPAVDCTKYQIDVLLYGKMFRNFIKNQAENNKPISDDIINDPEKLVDFIDNYSGDGSSRHKSRDNSKHAVSSLIGATKDDLNKLGIKVEKIQGKSLLDLAAEKGGTLEKSDYLNARENL